ncbi:MAG: L-serine ammonia-lyase, iron-sulfur-dependent, subunit alpha [Clostridiales bacterium]|nr:L-serine ammonia-lyase, iron-sulfur-dependent, subunit alpha [Clostridiales bacterium]
MEFISIFNDVIGPVMRGPSSSHTAGSYRIGRMARSLLGEKPVAVALAFDPQGSYARTYSEQGADLGFAAGFLEWSITDDRFPQALEFASRSGISMEFRVSPLEKADHPNTVKIEMTGQSGKKLHLQAQSTGGGLIIINELEDWKVSLTGKSFVLLIESERGAEPGVIAALRDEKENIGSAKVQSRGDLTLIQVQSRRGWNDAALDRLRSFSAVRRLWSIPPIFYVQQGEPLFSTAVEMISVARGRGFSLGRAALAYESALLGMSEEAAQAEMLQRWEVMRSAIHQGLQGEGLKMKLIEPSAATIFRAEAEGKTPAGGAATRAAARALAVLHVSNSGGVVCAAPTGASSGVIPAVLATLAEKKNLSVDQIALSLFAAGAVGLIIARRATFAAEIAGCQVEVGAAAAMAAAAVVEAGGGTAEQASDAAAISLQNTMGSVCDLVQGMCEIPCHTRNATAAASAFVCADMVIGGYKNPIPLDETIDAVFSVGRMLQPELRCTSLGGIALAPSAISLSRLK